MTAVPFNKQHHITDVAVHGDTASLDIYYPRIEGNPKYLEVGLSDVRASDGIRIHYDFDRDGFVISQPKPHLVAIGDRSYDEREEWIEVAFCGSWKFNGRPDGAPTKEEFEAADSEYRARKT